MSSDNHANYAKIGFTVIIGVIAIVGTLIGLGGLWNDGDEFFVETCYDKPVNGLSVGSVVNLRGVKIGEVREIGFIGHKYNVPREDNPRIYILMAFNRGLVRRFEAQASDQVLKDRIRMLVEKRGLRATVTASGITGLSRVECDFTGSNDLSDIPKISWIPRNAYIPPKVSLLDSFSDSATKVMNQINKMDLNAAWSNISASVKALSQATEGAKVMIETRQADIEQLIDDMSETSASVRDLTSELRRNPSLLIRERIETPLEETR